MKYKSIWFNEVTNLFNKIFIKEFDGGITDDINTLPKNKWLLVKLK